MHLKVQRIRDLLLEHKYIILVLLIAFSLRFFSLGYSNYQGDEIKALFIPESTQTVSEFLLSQRKGPVQFLITYTIKLIDFEYENRFFARFPFAAAGFLAVYYFYKFVKLYFKEFIAVFATFFFATNGFLVAFSRIVQYQSFVILFMVLALYYFSLAVKDTDYRVKGIYYGFIYWALSILSHYDGVFIFPFVAYILASWLVVGIVDIKTMLKQHKFVNNFKHVFKAGVIFILLLALFYVPFVLNIDEGTKSYWQGRLEGTGGKISSSSYLFSVYQPIYVIHIYTGLFLLGLVSLFKDFLGLEILLFVVKSKFKIKLAPLAILLTPQFYRSIALITWFLVPFVFMELLVDIPGTHIYTYLVPLFIILAYGIKYIEQLLKLVIPRLKTPVFAIGIVLVLSFIFMQSYKIFVENGTEYPWTEERFLLWTFPKPTPIFHLSIFGFPYYRGWEQIEEYMKAEGPLISCPNNIEVETCPFKLPKQIPFYSTNERSSIARYHTEFLKDTDNAGYYIYIRNPQSFTNDILSEKAEYWAENYAPEFVVKKCTTDSLLMKLTNSHEICEKDIAQVYYMPQGNIDNLKELGF